jgi:HAMP domain-containing protein
MSVDSIDAESQQDVTAKAPDEGAKRSIRIAMRWKLLAAFATAFTVVFVFIALYVLQFSTQNAQARLENELMTFATGGAKGIDAEQFFELVTTVPAVVDESNPFGLGYPTSPLYSDQARALFNLNNITGEALSYSYFKDPKDGKLYAAATSAFFVDPSLGYPYKVPISETSSPATNERMNDGLSQPILQPAYTDAYGSWISAYVPIVDKNGNTVGGLGVDYPITYVDEVKRDVLSRLLPILIAAYLILLGVVLLLSTTLVRPLKRLTAASARIADGEYDVDLSSFSGSRFPDEMYELAESFATMARKVGAREKSLSQEVQRLKVEIDQTRRAEAVREITENDSFADLARKAAEMRERMRKDLGKD